MADGSLSGRLEALARRLDDLMLRDGCRHGHPLGPMTTYRVGGAAAMYVRPHDRSELESVAAVLAGTVVPVVVVGRGSNLLVADRGFAGLALQLGQGFEGVDVAGSAVVAGGGASLPVVARRTVQAGLSGFEWAVGVPGSIGGAVRMNAGGHGSDMSAVLGWADVVDLGDGATRRLEVGELDLDYRHSVLSPAQVVAAAGLQLEVGDVGDGEAILAEISRWRRENQPGGSNAGSVFTNPPGDSAGRLIDLAGAKGLRIGTAEVSSKHANFIQADAGGSADDVRRLMQEVRRQVADAHGVVLHPETILVGFDVPDA
ncbi:MAG: UDP-N-acetylmuramate dehydrogenase [Acidimicrobiales bacterium]|nr:UDP-N-acetylmuramate dehydrogenase [Acidimicrobiales bacterium]